MIHQARHASGPADVVNCITHDHPTRLPTSAQETGALSLAMLRVLLPLPVLQPASSCDKALRLETAAELLRKEALPVCPSATSDLQC